MSKIELIMPKMGESVAEATIIKWVKEIGDSIELDETIVEIATDKVDSEIPSIAQGILIEKLYKENDIVKVGEVIAIIEDDHKSSPQDSVKNKNTIDTKNPTNSSIEEKKQPAQLTNDLEVHEEGSQKPNVKIETINEEKDTAETDGEKLWRSINEPNSPVSNTSHLSKENTDNQFYSPLVKSIVKKENITKQELLTIKGTGSKGRITKNNLLKYIKDRSKETIKEVKQPTIKHANILNTQDSETEIIEMDRMRKIIAEHMIMSKSTSAHVTSFVETDVSKIVDWRNRIKKRFLERENQNITYTPIIFESIIKAILDFPLINISVDGDKIIKHKNINLGMATALPNGNLIVPVIKKAQEKNILGLTKNVNDLAERARKNQLQPDEISGGTFTVTNVGSFGSVMGTPIINQPQVAILALGKIQKKATVIETDYGDSIGIRSKMFLSLSYDHRVVDGALGGKFLKRISDYLEAFDINKEI